MKRWKAHEHYWAGLHETKRTGPRGEGLPDLLDAPLAVECKSQQRRALRRADLKQAKENANAQGKLWALILHEVGAKRLDDIVVLPAAAYMGLIAGLISIDLTEETKARIDDMLDHAIQEGHK